MHFIECKLLIQYGRPEKRRSLPSLAPRRTVHPEHTQKFAPAILRYRPFLGIKKGRPLSGRPFVVKPKL